MRIQIAVAVVVFLSAVVLNAGPIADMYRKTHKDQKQDMEIPKPRDAHSITEIGLERTECYGMCPVYSVTIRADGSFTYIGKAHVAHVGEYEGNVGTYALNQLLNFIEDSNFSELKDSYSSPVTDLPTVYTMVMNKGERKIVSNYANTGPSKLWAIEQLIDKVVADADWSKATKK